MDMSAEAAEIPEVVEAPESADPEPIVKNYREFRPNASNVQVPIDDSPEFVELCEACRR